MIVEMIDEYMAMDPELNLMVTDDFAEMLPGAGDPVATPLPSSSSSSSSSSGSQTPKTPKSHAELARAAVKEGMRKWGKNVHHSSKCPYDWLCVQALDDDFSAHILCRPKPEPSGKGKRKSGDLYEGWHMPGAGEDDWREVNPDDINPDPAEPGDGSQRFYFDVGKQVSQGALSILFVDLDTDHLLQTTGTELQIQINGKSATPRSTLGKFGLGCEPIRLHDYAKGDVISVTISALKSLLKQSAKMIALYIVLVPAKQFLSSKH